MNIIILPFIFALLGYLMSSKTWLHWFDTLTPVEGLLVYYIAVIVSISILIYLGLVVAGQKFSSFSQLVGSVLIWFAFFVIIIWTNCYVATVVNGDCSNFSTVYLNTESGSTYYLWSKLTKDLQTRRILTFVVTPFVLSLLGLLLVSEKVSISPF